MKLIQICPDCGHLRELHKIIKLPYETLEVCQGPNCTCSLDGPTEWDSFFYTEEF